MLQQYLEDALRVIRHLLQIRKNCTVLISVQFFYTNILKSLMNSITELFGSCFNIICSKYS